MGSAKDWCQGTGVMGKFMFILDSGMNRQNEQKKWWEISKSKGKMPKLICQAEIKEISESLL